MREERDRKKVIAEVILDNDAFTGYQRLIVHKAADNAKCRIPHGKVLLNHLSSQRNTKLKN